MSKTPEHDKRPPGADGDRHPDVVASRAYELSAHDTAYWLHQKRVWAATELREAFLAGVTYGQAHPVDPSKWAIGYALYELAFCDVLGLEGNVPPEVARTKLRELKEACDAAAAKYEAMYAHRTEIANATTIAANKAIAALREVRAIAVRYRPFAARDLIDDLNDICNAADIGETGGE